MSHREIVTLEDWKAEACRLFGTDSNDWRFICPACGYETKVKEWRDAGAPEDSIGFSCVGRWLENPRKAFGAKGPGPCNYAGGGLFAINPVRVKAGGTEGSMFAFAEVKS